MYFFSKILTFDSESQRPNVTKSLIKYIIFLNLQYYFGLLLISCHKSMM